MSPVIASLACGVGATSCERVSPSAGTGWLPTGVPRIEKVLFIQI